jgi:hypothetical protein
MIALTLAYWELLGGFLTYAAPALAILALTFCVAASVAAAYLTIKSDWAHPLMWPALALFAAPVLSYFANGVIKTNAVPVFYGGALGVLVIASHVGASRLLDGLYRSSWLWLIGWPLPFLLGWPVSENITGLWAIVAIIVILAKGKPWWYTLPFIVSLAVLRGRAALLGLAVALLIYYRPQLSLRRVIVALGVSVFAGAALFAYRPTTALYRLSYWQQAVSAWQGGNHWFGLGPNGIANSQAILQPDGSGYQPHAHNIAVQFLAEFGLVGLALLALATWIVYELKPRGGWQAAILAGFLAVGLVDYPFACVGPLLVFAAIAGTMEVKLSNGRNSAQIERDQTP